MHRARVHSFNIAYRYMRSLGRQEERAFAIASAVQRVPVLYMLVLAAPRFMRASFASAYMHVVHAREHSCD